MNYYIYANIKIPNISAKFIKKIPLKIKLLKEKGLIDYRESPIKFFPFTKDHPTVYDSPYMNQPPYYGIRTDIRWSDYFYPGHASESKSSELY